MTGLEIGGIVAVATVGAAIFGLQAWKCSQNTQAEESVDDLVLDIEEMTVDGNKVTIKGLHVKANEVDKAKHKANNTQGDIGSEQVSLAAIGTLGQHGVGALGSILPAANAPQTITDTSANIPAPQSPVGSPLGSMLPPSGAQGTHITQPKADVVDNLVNALIGFVAGAISNQLTEHQNHEVTTPLLGGGHQGGNDVDIETGGS